jgi:hypothetical protein
MEINPVIATNNLTGRPGNAAVTDRLGPEITSGKVYGQAPEPGDRRARRG